MLLTQGEEAEGQSSTTKTILFGFGNSMYGQLGLGGSKDTLIKEITGEGVARFVFEPSPTSVQLPDPTENVVQVVCGLDHTVLRTGNSYALKTPDMSWRCLLILIPVFV